jgi:tRNA(adenine34) deaminase
VYRLDFYFSKAVLLMLSDQYFMQIALRQAQMAAQAQEIPVGAVIVSPQGDILAKTHNLCEQTDDVTAHAEILAIGAAAQHVGSKILATCTLYVTLEPCPMCAAALYWAQIGRVVFGASDEKRGYSRFSPPLLHPRTKITQGILAEDCAQMMKDFFAAKR